jgi:ATP-binding cassette subfamily B protein
MPHRLRLAAAIGNSALAGFLVLLLGQGLRRFVDRGLHGAPVDLDRAALGLLLITMAYGATTIGRSYFASYIGNRVGTDIRNAAFRRLVHEDIAQLERAGAARQWAQVMLDAASVQVMIGSLLGMVRSALIVVGGLLAMVLTSFRLSLVVLVLAPVVTLLPGPRRSRSSAWMASRRSRPSSGRRSCLAATRASARKLSASPTAATAARRCSTPSATG